MSNIKKSLYTLAFTLCFMAKVKAIYVINKTSKVVEIGCWMTKSKRVLKAEPFELIPDYQVDPQFLDSIISCIAWIKDDQKIHTEIVFDGLSKEQTYDLVLSDEKLVIQESK